MKSNGDARIVCFSCKFSWGYLAEEASIADRVSNWVPVICTGKIDAPELIEAFSKGADGVLILGCPEGDCHYQDGNCEVRKKVYLLQSVLEKQGIARERIRVVLDRDPDGMRIPELVAEMKKDLAALPEVIFNGSEPGLAEVDTSLVGGTDSAR